MATPRVGILSAYAAMAAMQGMNMDDPDFKPNKRTAHHGPVQWPISRANLPKRNDPCHCGSGVKFKKCCMGKQSAAENKNNA